MSNCHHLTLPKASHVKLDKATQRLGRWHSPTCPTCSLPQRCQMQSCSTVEHRQTKAWKRRMQRVSGDVECTGYIHTYVHSGHYIPHVVQCSCFTHVKCQDYTCTGITQYVVTAEYIIEILKQYHVCMGRTTLDKGGLTPGQDHTQQNKGMPICTINHAPDITTYEMVTEHVCY